ncbi:MAG: response regulator [Bacteroidetes bacterium]|nr:response regulator [Bacteroidota bacterium]
MTDNPVILCVDDEREILIGLQSQLYRAFGTDCSVEMAESAEEALELIDEMIPDEAILMVLISDQLMPGMKGHELLIKVHEKCPNTLKILLTGQANINAISEAVNKANLYRYMEKPWDGQDLILTVREAMKSYRQDDEIKKQNRLLEMQNAQLEQRVEERTHELEAEQQKSEAMLLNILPEEIANELKETGEAKPKNYKMATLLFTDFSGFTALAGKITPGEVVKTLNECFTAFDEIVERNNLEKIKTIGDAYMAAAGIPVANETNAIDAVKAALEIHEWVNVWNTKRRSEGKELWELRIGIHTGELVAGVIGKKKFAYDVWGDAVNIAARMESAGEVGKVNISHDTYLKVKDLYDCETRGFIPVKGKGEIEMFFVVKAK